MEFKILGPFEVSNEHGAVALGGVKPRAVLAVLLLNANEPVSAERLAQALWGDDVPAGAVKTVQVHVSRLRKALGDGDVVETTTRPATACACARASSTPSASSSSSRTAVRRWPLDDPEQAAAVLREALALWRGPPLAELAFEPFAQAEIARLEEQRLAARRGARGGRPRGRAATRRSSASCSSSSPRTRRASGWPGSSCSRCTAAAARPRRSRPTGEARRVLVDEIGVEPGPELRRLQEAILRQDASLEPEPVAAELPRELDAAAAPPLDGRDAELAWLRERWEQARDRPGRPRHGRTASTASARRRLAAELAGEAHAARRRRRAMSPAPAPPTPCSARCVRAREATRPTLLVIDDADSAPATTCAPASSRSPRASPSAPVLVLVPPATATPERSRGCARRAAPPPAARRRCRPRDRDCATPRAPRSGRARASGCSTPAAACPRRVHELGEPSGRGARRRAGSTRSPSGRGRPRRAALDGGRARRRRRRPAGRARARRARRRDDDAPVVCPFKGLASFDVADAPYFFGRERLVAELVARLVGAPLLGVVGPSGSGKSSVVRAGLLPALAGGVLPGSEHWAQVLIRPGEHPLRELRDASTGAAAGPRGCLAVDQFEETFTACRDEDERARVHRRARAAAGDRDAQTVVVLAIRADYYGRCAAYPELSRLLGRQPRPGRRRCSRDELRRAIERPAAARGPARRARAHRRARGRTSSDEPGALPLLSTALLELWQQRDGRRLRLRRLRAHGRRARRGRAARRGRVRPARRRPADASRAACSMRLAGEGADGGVERRRVPLAELETATRTPRRRRACSPTSAC